MSARKRIDQFWRPVDDFGCFGMGIHYTFDDAHMRSDLIALGRPLGVQSWVDPRYGDSFLLTFQVDEALKGEPQSLAPGTVQVVVLDPPPTMNLSDLDHVLFLTNRAATNELLGLDVENGDQYVYYLTDGYQSIYADVANHVVSVEYDALKATGLTDLYSLRFDGTPFDKLLTRIRNGPHIDDVVGLTLAQGGYFAC